MPAGMAAWGPRSKAGRHSFESLESYMLEKGNSDPNQSGRQEMLENLINQYI